MTIAIASRPVGAGSFFSLTDPNKKKQLTYSNYIAKKTLKIQLEKSVFYVVSF